MMPTATTDPTQTTIPGGKCRPISKQAAQKEALRIAVLLEGKSYGQVTITINDGRVVRYDETTKYKPEELDTHVE